MKKIVSLVASMFIAHGAFAADESGLTFDVYNASAGSFGVTSTVVQGETEVMVVDSGFTKADALRIAAKVLDSNKALKTIFISQADPDYYFGAETLHSLFPEAEIITTAAVKAVIEKKLAGKMGFWAPKMGKNAPQKPIVPEVYKGSTLTVDGHVIEIRGTEGVLAHRPYLWAPESKTILGNVAVFGNVHLWLADAQSDEMQSAWTTQLKEMLALNPKMVIPGHMKEGAALDKSAISFSLNYIEDFRAAKEGSKDSKEMIQTLSAKYPEAQGALNLDIAAKVHKGEMKW